MGREIVALQGRETSSTPVSTCLREKGAQCHPKRHCFVFFYVHETTLFCPKCAVSFKRKGAKMCQFLNQSSICMLFPFWSLLLNFFNQVPDWPSNFNTYAIKPLIWPDQLWKIVTWPYNFNFFQLKPKLTLKSFFLANKPSTNSIKPLIKFNWVHKHLILDFSFSN